VVPTDRPLSGVLWVPPDQAALVDSHDHAYISPGDPTRKETRTPRLSSWPITFSPSNPVWRRAPTPVWTLHANTSNSAGSPPTTCSASSVKRQRSSSATSIDTAFTRTSWWWASGGRGKSHPLHSLCGRPDFAWGAQESANGAQTDGEFRVPQSHQ